jgi:hypothetical protein
MDAQLLERSNLPYPGTIWMLSYWSGAWQYTGPLTMVLNYSIPMQSSVE